MGTSLGDIAVPYSKSGRFSVLTGQGSSDPSLARPAPTGSFRQVRYSTETATPFSNTTVFPTFL